MGIDASEVDHLIIDLHGAPGRMSKKNRKIVQRGAFNIRRGMGKDFSGHGHAPHLGTATFEVDMKGSNAFTARAEIGELDSGGPQWGIAAILAFGTSNNAPVVDHTAALRRETPIMLRYLAEAAEDAVLGGPE